MEFINESSWRALVLVSAIVAVCLFSLFLMDFWFAESRWLPGMGLLAALVIAIDVSFRVIKRPQA